MLRSSALLLKSLTPLGQRVLIQRTEAVTQTKSGILIPEQARGRINEGIVKSVATAINDWTPTVQVGDTVILPDYGGTNVKLDGTEFVLFNEDQLLGILPK